MGLMPLVNFSGWPPYQMERPLRLVGVSNHTTLFCADAVTAASRPDVAREIIRVFMRMTDERMIWTDGKGIEWERGGKRNAVNGSSFIAISMKNAVRRVDRLFIG